MELKSISVYVGMIILVVLSIGIGVMLYLYFTGYLQSIQAQTEENLLIKSIIECSKARLYIQFIGIEKIDGEEAKISNWLSGWQYRIPINITERSGQNLQDYQVLIIINTQNLISQNKMRSDCGDIRFTDSDGITLLNYWIESGCNNISTRIWVRVPNIPANQNKTIYMYYGNLLEMSLSNGDLVFLFFDDFSVKNTSKWNWPSSWNIKDGMAMFNQSGFGPSLASIDLDFQINDSVGIGVRFRALNNGSDADFPFDIQHVIVLGNSWYFAPYFSESPLWYGFFSNRCDGNGNCPNGITRVFREYEVIIFNNSQKFFLDSFLIDSSHEKLNNNVNKFELKSKGVGFFDYFFVRRIVVLEPLIYLKSEEPFKVISSMLILSNIGIDLGKKFQLKFIYDDEKVLLKIVELNETLKTKETFQVSLDEIDIKNLRDIEIYSLDVCPGLLLARKSIN